MDRVTDPGVIVAVITSVSAIVVAYITAAWARRSHDDDTVRRDLAEARARADVAENDRRLLMDYANQLRGDVAATGRPVRPWPDGLTS